MISTAVDVTRVSRVVGYKVAPANFEQVTPYLPQRLAILAEANTANQVTLSEDPFEFISANEVAEKYGYGSPAHQIARIIRPLSGNPLGGVPTVMYPQVEPVAGTPGVYTLGVAVAVAVTENATHKLIINGRDNIDGVPYSFSVLEGDLAADVTASIIDAINNVLSAPCTAAAAVDDVDITTKWAGATAALTVEVDTQGKSAGIIYSEVTNVAGTGSTDISTALAAFGENWNTVVINSYGEEVFSVLETFNGVPDPTSPTGRYNPIAFKPLVAFYGSTLSDKDDVVAITNDSLRQSQVTNVSCPAPNSDGMPWEAAANMAMVAVPIMQNSPHLDCSGKRYPDMPVPASGNIGDFSDYNARDFMVKKGSSTVNLTSGLYTVQDLVTTYAPAGEPLPKFRFVRDLNVDWNVGYNSILLMETEIQDRAILPDSTPSIVANIIKPKQGKQLYIAMIEDLGELALIADTDYSIATLQVEINATNPARMDIFFRYKRTSTAHIVSNDTEVDFNYTS